MVSIFFDHELEWATQVALAIKSLPADAGETRVQSLSWEASLEEEMAPHSSILAGTIPGTEEPGGYSPGDRKELDTTEAT